MRTLVLAAAALGACLWLTGCGRQPGTVPVSGTVTLDGKPLADGEVYFKTPQTGALESFKVTDGTFSGTAEPGDRRVEVYAFKVTTGDFNGMKGEVKESIVPAKYNTESTLTADVGRGKPNQFTFEVATK